MAITETPVKEVKNIELADVVNFFLKHYRPIPHNDPVPEELLDPAVKCVAIDASDYFAAARDVDSPMGSLIKYIKKAALNKKKVFIYNASKPFMDALKSTRLDMVIGEDREIPCTQEGFDCAVAKYYTN